VADPNSNRTNQLPNALWQLALRREAAHTGGLVEMHAEGLDLPRDLVTQVVSRSSGFRWSV